MKYLKQFKENKDDYYTRIKSNTRFYQRKDAISLPQKSIEYIKNIFKNKDVQFSFENFQGKELMCIFNSINGRYKLVINISELPDEYFLLDVYLYNKETEYYICDQLDGIKELLVDLKVI